MNPKMNRTRSIDNFKKHKHPLVKHSSSHNLKTRPYSNKTSYLYYNPYNTLYSLNDFSSNEELLKFKIYNNDIGVIHKNINISIHHNNVYDENINKIINKYKIYGIENIEDKYETQYVITLEQNDIAKITINKYTKFINLDSSVIYTWSKKDTINTHVKIPDELLVFF